MQSHYLNRLRSALRGLAANLSWSHWVDHIESRCTYFEDANASVSFPEGSRPCVYGGIWFKGEYIGNYNEYEGTPARKEAIRKWIKRQLCKNIIGCIIFIGVCFALFS